MRTIRPSAPQVGPATTIREHRRFAVELARRLGRGRIDPEDLAQDVLERWLRSSPRTAIANPQAWMRVVMRRLLIDRLRRRATAGPVVTDRVDRIAAASDADPWWCDLDVGAIERELAHLPPALRDAFRMFSFEARSYQQIARQQNVAMGTVATRVSRARAQLKRRLSERWQPAST